MIDITEYYSRAVELYHTLHQIPELGFDLEQTVAVVKSELTRYGIPYTEKYGKCSVVAEIGSGDKILALRADMDALPIEEKTNCRFLQETAVKCTLAVTMRTRQFFFRLRDI